MKIGKISENVLKRSVLKYIHKGNESVLKGAEVGSDCAFLSWKPQELAVSVQTVTLPIKEAAKYAVYAAVSDLAAGGMQARAAGISVTLPAEAPETVLQELMRQAETVCQEFQMQIIGGHTEVTKSVNAPIITVTAFGSPILEKAEGCDKDIDWSGVLPKGHVKPNCSLVMTKWIGLEGTVILAKEKEAQLLTRYPHALIKEAQGFEKYLPILPEAATALKSGVCAMHDVRNGGVFGALFELSRSTGVGLSVDLKQIPIKQETIEICEFYDLNPYELLSGGCLLLVAEDAEALVEVLAADNIPAVVIGKTKEGNDKVVINGEEVRFIEPAKPDEIFKINFGPDGMRQ